MKRLFYLLVLILGMIGQTYAAEPKVIPSFGVSTSVSVNASAVFKDTLIIAGDFTSPAQRLIQWDGNTTANPAGATFDAAIRTMLVYNNELIVGGTFTSPANAIVRWDGTTWNGFGTGANGAVNCMTLFNSSLIIGGNFTAVDGIAATNLARFDGVSWSAIPDAPNGIITSMIVYRNELYVSGTFTLAGALSVTNIAKFDGINWSALGTGLNSAALTMAIFEDTLYVGGDFTTANAIPVNRLAKWDGTTWYSTGPGADASVNSLLVQNGVLYVAGNFTSLNGVSTNRIGVFENAQWGAIAGGTDNTVNTMIVYKKDLYLGGSFTNAFGTVVSGVGRARMAASEPTIFSSGVNFTNPGVTTMNMYWQKGNGNKRLVTLKKDSSINDILADATPLDTVTYPANAAFTSGTELGYKNYVVSNNADTSIAITNLEAATQYYYNIWEFNDYNASGFENYSGVNVQGSFYTLSEQPDTAASNFQFSQVTMNSMRVSFSKGSGMFTLVVARKDSAVTALPTDGIRYTVSTNFGLGDALNDGQFAVFYRTGNTDTTFILNNLDPGTTYHFTAYELNALNSITPTTFNYTTTNAPMGSQSSMFTEPTVVASNFKFTEVTENSMRLTVNKGNGTSRMIVCVENGGLSVIVQDGKKYNFNSSFPSAPELFPSTGTRILYVGNDSSVMVSDLNPDKYYEFGVIEFNGDSLSANYMSSYNAAYRSTLGATPIKPADSISFSQFTMNSMRLVFRGGDGVQRIVVAKEKSAVTFVPRDTVYYPSNQFFGAGDELGDGNYVVYNGTGDMVDVYNLRMGIKYYYAVYEYNGSVVLAYNYADSAATGSHYTLSDEPTENVSRLQVINTTSTSMTLTWERGTGNGRIVIGRKAGVIYGPEDGYTYTANATFGQGSDLELGQYVVYKGTTSSVTVVGLEPNTTYYFAAYEYIGDNGSENYLYTNVSHLSQTTLVPEPTVAASALQMTPITNGISRITWTNGNGANRVVVVSENKEVSRIPDDEKGYSYSETFGFGEDIGDHNYVCYMGENSAITLQGLDETKAYYAVVIEYNGSGMGSNYLTSSFPKVNNLPAKPGVMATEMQFTPYDTTDAVRVSWQNGDGNYRILVAKAGEPVKFDPRDGEIYLANDAFGQGMVLPDGSFVVYSGADNFARVRNLEKYTTYHFALFEFNKDDVGPRSYADDALNGSFSRWTVGLEEQSLASDIKIFPNPNNGSFNIQNVSTNTLTVSVFDINGKEITNGKSVTGLSQETIQLMVQPGVYFVKVTNETGAHVQRLMITE